MSCQSRIQALVLANALDDFLTSIPIPPVFGGGDALRSGRAYRMVRMLRMFRALQALRVLRVLFFFWRGLEQIGRVMNVRLMKRSLMMMLVIILLGGVMIELTDGQSQQIASFWDRIWWSFTTTVTGGFADLYNPTSSGGRFLTVALIIAGMVIVGVFTATLTSVLIREDNESLHELEREIEEMRHDQNTFYQRVINELEQIKSQPSAEIHRSRADTLYLVNLLAKLTEWRCDLSATPHDA